MVVVVVENGLVVAWVGRRVGGLEGCFSCLPPVCAEGCETAHGAQNHGRRRGSGNRRWGNTGEDKGRLEAAESIEKAKLEFQLVEFARESSTDG